MATQVQLGSALTSLDSRSGPRSEATFRHSFISSLSDTSRTPEQGRSSLAPLVLEGRSKLGKPVCPATMPSTMCRLPWTPKPFSREGSSDTFATVKPPIPALKPGSATPKPPPDTSKGPTGSVPPLLDRQSVEGRSPREPAAHLPFYPSPQANTVILFESRSPAQGPPKEEGPRAQEGQLLRSQSEKWPRRQPLLSSDPRPHWKEAVAGAPKGSASSLEPQQRPALAAESQAGGRPAALAGFQKSWLEQTQPNPPRAASGPGTPKPRPLPTDLTGRFETQEFSWQRKPCLTESRENSFLAAGGRAPEAPGTRGTAAGLSGAALSGSRAKSASQLPESPQSCFPSAGGAASPGQTVPGDSGQNPAKESGSQARPSVGQPSAGQGQPLEEGAEVPPKETSLRNVDLPDASEGKSRGCARKASLFPNPPAPAESEPLHDSPGKESRTLNIQQRIKVLTAENVGPQAGSLRRSFRSRPLSTDLTKVFSGPVTASEPKPKRQPEWSRKTAGEMPDAPQDEALPVGEADVGEAGMAGSPLEPPLPAKKPSTEGPPKRQGSFARGRPDASLPGGGSSSALSPKVRTFSSSSSEEACPKTVRATMFEHHVQRHSVVAGQPGAEPAWLSLMAPFGDSPARGQALRMEGVLGDSPSADAAGPRGPRPFTEDKGCPTWEPASKGVEGSLLAQRIEPRYEVLQAVGERAQSEALAAVSEGKAVTLRRQRPLQEDQRASGCGRSEGWRAASALGTSPPKDPPGCGSQGALYSEGPGPGRSSEKAASCSVMEGSNFASWLESEKERRLLAEEAKAPDRAPERTRAWAPEADGCEGAAGMLGQKTTSLPESSPWPRASCPGLLFSLNLKPPQGPEDSGGQPLRSARHGARDKSEGAAEGRESEGLSHEARWASGIGGISAPRASGRWRRKTLPQGTARLEEPRERPPGPAELTSRRDALHLMGGLAAKGSPQVLRAPDPEQAEAAPPSSPKKPLPPPEPKAATYFALTCQVSEEIDSRAGRAAVVAARGSASGRAGPSSRQSREGGSAPGRPLSRRRGQRGALDHPGTGASWDPPAEAREQGQREPEVGAEGHPAGADPPLCPGARSPYSLAPLQDGQQKRSSALGPGRAEETAPDHYRSRVVDLDELMAEYGGEPQQLCVRGPRRESSSFPWEKYPSRSPFPGNLPCSSEQREGTRVEPPLGSRGPGTEASCGCRRDPLESRPRESRAQEGKCSPPQWARPDAEKPKPRSAEPSGPRTKTSLLVDRGQAESSREATQSARNASPGPHPARLGPGALWKEVSPKQWAALAPTGAVCPPNDWGGKTGQQAEPPAGVWQKGSPPAHTGSGPSSPASPGTGATPDRRRSSSEKTRQSPARPGLPWGPRLDQPHVCQRPPPERPLAWLSQGGPSPMDCSSHRATGDPGKGSLGPECEDVPIARRSASLLTQRRSHSFYQERRTDHWSGGHLKECFGRPSAEARDTDVLVQESSSSCTPESPSSEGRVAPAQKPSPGRPASGYSPQRDPAAATDQRDSSREQRSPSPDADPASPPTEKGSPDFSFLEQTARLDSGALKSRALLGKRRQRQRAPISQAFRRGADAQPALFSAAEAAGSAWMFRDSTEVEPPRREEEEGPPPAERMPLFPGPAPSTLKAQLRKRPEPGGRKEEGPPAPLCKSPKGPFPAGGRAVVATPKKEGRPEDLPPPWLTELKSRRKQGQLESPI